MMTLRLRDFYHNFRQTRKKPKDLRDHVIVRRVVVERVGVCILGV
jgi:hypothetical protein